MKLGISTACLYPMETERAFKTLLGLDFEVFEIFFNSFSELEDNFIDCLKNMNKANRRIKSIHPFTAGFESFLLFSSYYRRFQDGIKLYEKYFHAAQRIGAKLVVLHGDKYGKEKGISDEEYFKRFEKLSEVAELYGVILAQENVNLYRSQRPQFIREMKQYLGKRAAFVLDIKQAVRAKEDPFVICDAMGERLIHVHLNDHDEKSDCLLPGRGNMDYNRLASLLKKHDYKGDIVIEVYNENFQDIREFAEIYHKIRRYFHCC